MHIIAIDPGTTNTGLVYMNEREILAARTIHNKNSCKTDQYALMERAEQIARMISDWITDKPHTAVVIEGFQTFSNRQNSYTFQTPYLCGYLERELADEDLIIQTSSEVFGSGRGICKGCRTSKEIADRKNQVVAKYRGGDKCINEHTRSAACHGIYFFKEVGCL